MRRRRDWLVLAASLCAHLALLAAWLSKRPDFHFIEPPAMTVELLRLRPPPPRIAPPQQRAQVQLEKAMPETPPAIAPLPPPTPPAARPLTDEELLAGPRLIARQIREAPVKDGSWDHPPRPPRPKCKPAEGYPGPPLPCPGEIVNDPNRPFDVDRDAPDSELAREGRYKRAMKRYHELPGAAGYPGVACAIFHRC